MAVQLLSGDWVRLSTHFWRSTFLCPEVEECDVCDLLPARAYWYLPVLVVATQRPSILELSAHASADLEQRCRFVGSAPRPGVEVELSRRSKKAPLRCEYTGQAERPAVARLHEWVTPLMALYRLPAMTPAESLEEYGCRVRAKVIERAKLVAGQMRAASSAGSWSR
jgi:hypothetical protein